MYAVIDHKGKQYRATKGETITVDLLTKKPKSKVTFSKVLLYVDSKGTKVGSPNVKGAKVEAEVVEETKGPKVISGKFKAKKRYRRRIGHRQKYTKVKITEIKTT